MPYTIEMHRSQLPRSGIALGGIGTGTFELRQDGGFYNWTIFNNAPLFAGAPFPHNGREQAKSLLFFKVWLRRDNETPRILLLQIEESHGAATMEHHEHQYIFPWLTGADTIRTSASFPFTDLEYRWEGLPLVARLRAWSPFVPGSADDSSLPLAYFDLEVESEDSRPAEVQLLAVGRNAAGYDQPGRCYANRRMRGDGLSGVEMGISGADPAASSTGAQFLGALDGEARVHSGWEHPHPYYERLLREYPLPETDDTAGRNSHDEAYGRATADPRCFCTVGCAGRLEERGDRFRRRFLYAWHFPNNYAKGGDRIAAGYLEDANFGSDGGGDGDAVGGPEVVRDADRERPLEGHRYGERFADVEAVARHGADEAERLEAATEAFHRCFYDSSLPLEVLDAVNAQLNTLRTSTWLTATGMFGVLEGLSPSRAFAGIATTDVAMYGQIAVSLLFPELDRMTIDIWTKFQSPSGAIVHSVSCDSTAPATNEINGRRVDLPAQYSFMALRAGLWSGDHAYLEAVWPNVKAALAYVLRERDKNGDHLPDMEGIMCSYDNFPMYGVAPYVVSQWLAAVALALDVAERLEDTAFVDAYRPLFESGRKTFVEATWNGDYFNLYSDTETGGADEARGCLTDQIVGCAAQKPLGQPGIVAPANEQRALATILRMNFKPEQGLRNCQWPEDELLHPVADDCWVDQANTCWTGVEYSFAAHLYAAGKGAEAERLVRQVEARHRRWGMVWDHQEFGGHYFRPLSALAIPNSVIGLSYDGATLRIEPPEPLPYGRWCVLLPGAYGTFVLSAEGLRLELRSGTLRFRSLEWPGGAALLQHAGGNAEEAPATSVALADRGITRHDFEGQPCLRAGDALIS